MKKLSVVLVFLLMITVLVSCGIYETTKDVISKNEVDEVPQNNETIVPETEIVTVRLYFPDNDALYLHAEERSLEVEKGESLAPLVLQELFKGPESEDLSPSLDGENLVLSVSVSEGLCTVDFASDFALLNSGGTTKEAFAIGSIVNSLCELDGIQKVKINIDGNKNAEFGGHFTLESTFSAQPDLIAK
ncbi:MAG: GerMN domain-containing protein [Clostridia bacterium]|nr:GerMN domain-containing protein [Clostridia bacterium]